MNNRISVLLSLLLCSSFTMANTVSTDISTRQPNFIQQRALGPIKLQTGLPAAASRLTSSSEIQLSLTHNNVFMGGQTNTERLVLDGESSQLNFRYRQRLNSCWQLNVSGAILAHSKGWFDRPVDDWHQFFGLPDAKRGESPANQLTYQYESDSAIQALTSSTNGFGDVQLQIQRNWGCAAGAAIMRVGIKLPLGDPNQFHGDGSVDGFMDVQSPWYRSNRYSRVQWAASIGVLGGGKNEQVAKREALVGFGAAGLNVAVTPRSTLLVQLDWHTPMYESNLRELGELSVQLSLGWRYQTLSTGAWEFSFSEDASVDTVPDISIRLAWVSRFDGALGFK